MSVCLCLCLFVLCFAMIISKLKQTGVELCQAQVKLEVIGGVAVEFGV